MFPAEVCGAQVRLGLAAAPPDPAPVDARLWSGQARLVANRRHARLDIAGVGRLTVVDGAEITVQPAAGVDDECLTTMLYGPIAALALAQRGEFALHASTVAIGSAGVALAGRSGAGKSTTALALEQRGHRLVTDDVSPVRRPSGATAAEVVPFGRPRHVWPDAAATLGLDLTGSRLVDRGQAKLSLPARPSAPAPLRAVVVLQPDAAATRIEATRLGGLASVPALLGNAYRVQMLARLWAPDLFAWAAELSRTLAVWTLTRPQRPWTVDAVGDAVAELAAAAGAPAGVPCPAQPG